MANITFDKLAYTQALRAGGFTDQQAEASAHALDNAFRDVVATKGDVEAVRTELGTTKIDLEHKIEAVRLELDTKIDRATAELRQEIVTQKIDLLKWLVPLLFGQAALIVAFSKLL